MKKIFLTLIIGLFVLGTTKAQETISESPKNIELGTNIYQWLKLGTIDARASYGFLRNHSLGVTFDYNNWLFRKGSCKQFNNNVLSLSLDYQYWLWHIYSGTWLMVRAKGEQYNRGGISSSYRSRQGYAVGLGLGAGYSLMIRDNINLNFGVVFWGGKTKYKEYDCPFCGYPKGTFTKPFVDLDEVIIGVSYVF